MRTNKNKQGISLIVLVITIIIMIILATAIILSLNNSGIIGKASKAKNDSDEAARKETEAFDEMELMLASQEAPWSNEVADGFAGGDGTEASPYLVETGSQLAYLAKQVNDGETYAEQYIALQADIDLGYKAWTPIGIGQETLGNEAEGFAGHFNGNGHTISKVNVNLSNIQGVGLFGIVGETATIDNINVSKGKIVGDCYVGGVAGVSNGTIKNCTSNVQVVAQDNATKSSGNQAGGIVGQLGDGIIENCINYGSAVTKNECKKTSRGKMAGGIIGLAVNSTIKNCTNYGSVKSEYQQAGGIVGAFDSCTIENCVNEGNILAVDSVELPNSGICVGGIAGFTNLGYHVADNVVINCINKGTVSAESSQVGGVIGCLDRVFVSNCSNSGVVSADMNAAGGIAGYMTTGSIAECVNSGTVISKSADWRGVSGGIVGWLTETTAAGTVSKCYNTGKICCGNYSDGTVEVTGGIVGLLFETAANVEYCYSSCEFENNEAVGEIVGQWNTSGSASVSNCYYTNETIKGIGSKGTDNTIITSQDDQTGITEKVSKIGSFDSFKKWMKNKHSSLTFES